MFDRLGRTAEKGFGEICFRYCRWLSSRLSRRALLPHVCGCFFRAFLRPFDTKEDKTRGTLQIFPSHPLCTPFLPVLPSCAVPWVPPYSNPAWDLATFVGGRLYRQHRINKKNDGKKTKTRTCCSCPLRYLSNTVALVSSTKTLPAAALSIRPGSSTRHCTAQSC